MRSALTTFGISQLTQSAPKLEYVAPSHCSHIERSAEGALPGTHASQNVWAEFGKCADAASHTCHRLALPYLFA